MSELHTLIRRSIIDRGLTSAAERQDVYQQARTAVIRELWSYDPPLAEDEIDARIGQFDLAIGELEDDLAETFAEAVEAPPAAPPRPPAKRTATVFEGYDHDVDYVPAYVAPARQSPRRLPPPGQGRASRDSLRSPGGADGGGALDPLALRSAAIEEALRSGDDRFVSDNTDEPQGETEIAGYDDGYPVPEEDDDRQRSSWSWDHDRSGPADYDSETDAGESEPGADEFAADEPEEESPRRVPKLPWTAVLSALEERTRIRILIGAIAGLGVVLVVLAGFMLSSLFSKSDGDTGLAAAAATAPDSGGNAPAATPVAPSTDALQTFAVFDGSDPTVFDSGSGNPVRFDKSGGFARITSSTSDAGVRVVVGAGVATRVSGRSVRVTLIARASRENGATGLRFAYENGLAISPWQTANLGNEFQTYNLVWRVPSMRADPNADQLLIEPGIPGDGTAADIQSIRIDVLP